MRLLWLIEISFGWGRGVFFWVEEEGILELGRGLGFGWFRGCVV